MSNAPANWRQIERAIADYLRSLGVVLGSDGGGETVVELSCCDAGSALAEFPLSDLAKFLEREFAAS